MKKNWKRIIAPVVMAVSLASFAMCGSDTFNNDLSEAEFTSIPFSLAQAVDDLGWKTWENKLVDDDHNAAKKAISEVAVLEDYQNLFDIGKNTGTRIMTAWIDLTHLFNILLP